MGLETGVTKPSDLNEAWPLSSDVIYQGFQHLKTIKTALKGVFVSDGINFQEPPAQRSYIRNTSSTIQTWSVGKPTTGSGIVLSNDIEGSSISLGGSTNGDKRIYMNAGSGGDIRMNAPLIFNNGYVRMGTSLENTHGYTQLVYTDATPATHEIFSMGKTSDNIGLYLNATAAGASIVIGGGTIAAPTKNINYNAGAGQHHIFNEQLTIPAVPVANTDAASKQYVDAHIGLEYPWLSYTDPTVLEYFDWLGSTTTSEELMVQITDKSIYIRGIIRRAFKDGTPAGETADRRLFTIKKMLPGKTRLTMTYHPILINVPPASLGGTIPAGLQLVTRGFTFGYGEAAVSSAVPVTTSLWSASPDASWAMVDTVIHFN